MGGILAAVVVLWLVATAYLFVWPDDDPVGPADALVVLGPGQHDERLHKAAELMRKQVARALVVSEPKAKRGWVKLRAWCSDGRAICFRARPFTTRGEAREVARLAERHNWHSLIVVTSRYHVVRARLLYRRCFNGPVMVVGAPSSKRELLPRLAHEWGGLLYALTLARDC